MPNQSPKIRICADVAAFSVEKGQLQTLIKGSPSSWQFGVPVEFIKPGSPDIDVVAERAVRSITRGRIAALEQLRTETIPAEAEQVARIGYLAVIPFAGAKGVWTNAHELTRKKRQAQVPYHHNVLVEAIGQLQHHVRQGLVRNDLSPLVAFLPDKMTKSELREIQEAIEDRKLNPANFDRKATSADGLIDTGERRQGDTGRPAEVYRYQRPRSSRWP